MGGGAFWRLRAGGRRGSARGGTELIRGGARTGGFGVARAL